MSIVKFVLTPFLMVSKQSFTVDIINLVLHTVVGDLQLPLHILFRQHLFKVNIEYG